RWRIVSQLAVLDDRMRDVDAESGDAAVEPEAQDPVERITDVLVPPVEVGLRRKELVEVVLPARFVEGPCGQARVERHVPVVGWRAVRLRISPHVPVAVLCGARRARVDEPWLAVARVVRNDVEDNANVAGG